MLSVMDLGLRGQRVLITGASRGIGAAAADAFAAEGCDLHLVARDAARLEEVAHTVAATHGVAAATQPADLRDPTALAEVAAACTDVDVLVNNAGDIPGGSLEAIDDATWQHAWDLKVHGYIRLTRLIYAQMKARGHGVIVNDIGASGERPLYHYIAGSTGNAALIAFTRALGGRSLNDNIRVVGVAPGPVATTRITSLEREVAASGRTDVDHDPALAYPLGRAAHPEEIASAMAFLASPRSGYTTGAILSIDGGLFSGWA